MKILLVEDEKDLNQIIAKCLKKDGYSVDCAFCGKEALEFLDVAKYDAIVLDAMMPVMDGFEFLKAARARGLGTPVLFLTARDAKEDIIAVKFGTSSIKSSAPEIASKIVARGSG